MPNLQKILKSAYYRNCRIDSSEILYSDKGRQMPFVSGPNTGWQTVTVLVKSKNRHIFLKKSKNPNIRNGLTDRHEIWHGDAFSTFLTVSKVKISKI